MNRIARDEMKARVDRGEPIKLVMVQGDWEYDLKYIPNSLHSISLQEALRVLRPDDEIILYCSMPECAGSWIGAQLLEARGYRHVQVYLGGLAGWEAAGYPVEGKLVVATPDAGR